MYDNGPIDPLALKAFNTLKGALISEPEVAFPQADRCFALIDLRSPHPL